MLKFVIYSVSDSDSQKLDSASALPNDTGGNKMAAAAAAAAIADDDEIDENLFDGEDLDLVEEELDTLELTD